MRADRATRWQVERLAELLEALARALRTGTSLHGAVAVVARDRGVAGPAFVDMARRMADGGRALVELDRWARTLHHPDADLVRALLATGVTTGGELSRALDRAAEGLRARADARREAEVLGAQARVSAVVLTAAPVAFLAFMAALDPRVLRAALGPTGRVAVGLGVLLDLVGWWWMRRLAAIDR